MTIRIMSLEEAAETLIDPYMENTKWFTYCYDFGDGWEHRVDIEEILPDCDYDCPAVLKARGACPFEDCGGIGGYYYCLEALQDEKHEEHSPSDTMGGGHGGIRIRMSPLIRRDMIWRK